MKTTSLLTIIFLFSQINLFAKTDIQNLGLKGNIKAISTIEHHTLKKGKHWLKGKIKSQKTTKFNTKGFKIEETNYIKGSLRKKFKYDYKNLMYAKDFCKKKTSKKNISTTFAVEDTDIIKNFCKKFKKRPISIVYVYNAEKSFSDKGKNYLSKSVFNVLNKKNMISDQYNLNSMGELEVKKVFKYAKKSAVKTIEHYDFTDTLIKKEILSFNQTTKTKTNIIMGEHGRVIKKIITDFRDDDSIRKKDIIIYDDGEGESSKTETFYDKYGHRSKESFYSAGALEPFYEYHYTHKRDKKGNWIYEKRVKTIAFYGKKIIDKTESPRFITRNLSYYGKANKKTGSVNKRSRLKSHTERLNFLNVYRFRAFV